MSSLKKRQDATFMLKQLLELVDALNARKIPLQASMAISSVKQNAEEYRQKEGRILAELEERRASGESYAAIAIALNRRGVRGRYGGRWYTSSVRAILQRSRAKSAPC